MKGETNVVSETILEKFDFEYIDLGNGFNFIWSSRKLLKLYMCVIWRKNKLDDLHFV